MQPKLIAFHLPQYHVIPENNQWWGEGFTDWVNVKKAKPLFKGHDQPRIPLYGRYYDMTKVETLKWQCELAKKYGIYGFCYYHYWFNGKLLLEKPIEMLLENKDIDTNYCLCWANENWARTWDGKDKQILIKQDYSDESDWEKHIHYLIKFFDDPRYIRVDGHPVFVVYKTKNIERIEEMVKCWNSVLILSGRKTLYIVEMLGRLQKQPCIESSSAFIEFEPAYTGSLDEQKHKVKSNIKRVIRKFKHLKLPKEIRKYFLATNNYELTVKDILERPVCNYKGKQDFIGLFAGWDNTPRKGIGGTIFLNYSTELFKKLAVGQYKKAKDSNNEFIFMNAWNEWAEGTYLEPDERYKYEKLEVIREVFGSHKLN